MDIVVTVHGMPGRLPERGTGGGNEVSATGHPYTSADDAVIVANYGRISQQRIAALLGRANWRGVQHRIDRLIRYGVIPERRAARTPPWSEEDDELLAELWGLKPDRLVAKRLGRTVAACEIRAKRTLGMSRSQQFLNARTVGRLFGVDEQSVVRWQQRGWLTGKPSTVGAGGGRYVQWRFDAAAVWRFIRRHPYAYDRTRIERGSYERNLADAVYARDPWLTAAEAARELGVSHETVQAHLRRGWLAGKRVQRTGNHGTWYLRRAELARFRLRRPPAAGSLGNPDWGAGQWHRRRRAAGTAEAAG